MALWLLSGAAAAQTGVDPLPFPVRSIDGTSNNPGHPEWGSTGTALRRITSVDYGDGLATPAGSERPSARAVSNGVVAQAASQPAAAPISDFVWQWGQFVDHDIDLTEAASPAEAFDIEVPFGDPWFDPLHTGAASIALQRSLWMLQGGSPVRQQVNQITAFIDGSNVYGSDPARAAALRLPDGHLRTSAGDLLPFNLEGLPNAPSSDPAYFLAGDVRANEQNGLTALHTLFVREHNRLVDSFAAMGVPQPMLYEAARAVVGAELQAITYGEFLPRVLGPDALPAYAGWDARVDPSIANAFSTGCYRFGHTMLSPTLLRLRRDLSPIAAGNLPLREAFFAPQAIVDHGIEPLLRGLALQRPQEIDVQVVDDVRNFLFGAPGAGGFDLASLNIQRGRDHGLPSYNQARSDLGLLPASDFAEISSDREVQARLAATYLAPDDVDLWVGMLAEDHLDGALVGELAHAVLVDQFTRLRDGDRFWYEAALPDVLVTYVQSRSLAYVIRDNTNIGDELPDHVFIQAWTDLGLGLAGSHGQPQLSAQGSLLADTPLAFSVTAMAPGTRGLFAVGVAALSMPFKGGTLVPWVEPPLGLVMPFASDGLGQARLQSSWPGDAPPGLSLYAQAWMPDAGAPLGMAATNALRGDCP